MSRTRPWDAAEVARETAARQARVRRDGSRSAAERARVAFEPDGFVTEFAGRDPSLGQVPIDEHRQLVEALHAAGVEYVVIGGHAVRFHGYVRSTRDLDIVPADNRANLERLAGVLRELDARQLGQDEPGGFSADEFPYDPTNPDHLAEGSNFRLTTPHGDLDIMQWVEGVDDPAYTNLRRRAIDVDESGFRLSFASLVDLRAMKRAAGRPRDLDDLEHLGHADD